MKLAYIWIENDFTFKDTHLNLSIKFKYKFNQKSNILDITENSNYIDNFYQSKETGSHLKDLKCIVGENGAGKTTLLNLIAVLQTQNAKDYFENRCLVIWQEDEYQDRTIFFKYISNQAIDIKVSRPDFHIQKYPSRHLYNTILYNNYFADKIEFEKEFNRSKNIKDLRTNSLLRHYKTKAQKEGHNLETLTAFEKEEMRQKINYCIQSKRNNTSTISNILGKIYDNTQNISFYAKERKSLLFSITKPKKLKAVYSTNPNIVTLSKKQNQILNTIINALSLNLNKTKNEMDFTTYKSNDKEKIYLLTLTMTISFVSLIINSIANSLVKKCDDEMFYQTSKTIKTSGYINLNNFLENFINELQKCFANNSKPIYWKETTTLDYTITSNWGRIKESVRQYIRFLECLNCAYWDNLLTIDLIKNKSITTLQLTNNIYGILNSYYDSINIFDNIGFLDFSWEPQLSSGENALFTLFSRLNNVFYNIKNNSQFYVQKHDILILLDEAEIGFHPAWQKLYIHQLIKNINYLITINDLDCNVQIILTTNNPILLSDVLNEDVIYLKDHQIVYDIEHKTFGTDLLTLFANSFFISDGLIGKFAYEKIQDIINYAISKKYEESKHLYFSNLVENIGDELIKNYLLNLLRSLRK